MTEKTFIVKPGEALPSGALVGGWTLTSGALYLIVSDFDEKEATND